jgi:molybdate transport system substrate-binding protein
MALPSSRAKTVFAIAFLFAALAAPAAIAGTVHVAVAANFTEPAKEIAAAFKAASGHDAVLSFGASGPFQAQITQGAPFEVFLSADAERPKKLVDDGFALASNRFTYAIGKLVLWSAEPGFVQGAQTLQAGAFSKLAIANPAAAPYGVAALETLKALKLGDSLQSKIVMGESITQAQQFIETRNAELGFIALSQLAGLSSGSRWLVPQELYSEIRQDAVLLKTGATNEAASAFLLFLKGPAARAVIERYGYALATGG